MERWIHHECCFPFSDVKRYRISKTVTFLAPKYLSLTVTPFRSLLKPRCAVEIGRQYVCMYVLGLQLAGFLFYCM